MTPQPDLGLIGLTGASGFIGQWIYRVLAAQHPVCRLMRPGPGDAVPLADPPLGEGDELGDLRNSEARNRFCGGLQVLIHLAWKNNPRSSIRHADSEQSENIGPTRALFEQMASHNPEAHIIFASTGGAIYENSLDRRPRRESDPLGPESNYGHSKVAIENCLKAMCTGTRLRATVLRLGNPYGVILPVSRSQGLIGVALSCALTGEKLPLFGSRDTVRDYIHLTDVAQAFALSIARPPQPGEMRIFNVGSGQGTTTGEVLATLERITERRIVTEARNSDFDPSWIVLDTSKIHADLGWSPRYPGLEDGIRETWQRETRKDP